MYIVENTINIHSVQRTLALTLPHRTLMFVALISLKISLVFKFNFNY